MKAVSTTFDFSGRVALLTGSAGRLGKSVASFLASLGCDLILIDVDSESLEQQQASLASSHSVAITTHSLDLLASSDFEQVLSDISRHHHKIDILVNNAAFVGSSDLQGWVEEPGSQDPDLWPKVLELNLTVPFRIVQALVPNLRRSPSPSVINIASIYGIVAPDFNLYKETFMGNPAAYAASKGGLIQLTRWLSSAYAPEIRFNCISPGGIFDNQPRKFVEKYEAKTPVGRMASVDDFPGVVAFLASDWSQYITGQNLVVDGGFTCI